MQKFMLFMLCMMTLAMQAQNYAVLGFEKSNELSVIHVDSGPSMFALYGCGDSAIMQKNGHEKMAEKMVKGREAEAYGIQNDEEWVDLGLRSGTLWKKENEESFYTYQMAVDKFGDNLPTKKQFKELKNKCHWYWTGEGYKVYGPNGKYIVLPAAGSCCPNDKAGVAGYYWSSTLTSSGALILIFASIFQSIEVVDNLDAGASVRLVRNTE